MSTSTENTQMDPDSTTDFNEPEAVQILKVNEETKKFELDEEALSSILLHEKAKDKPLAVISIAGDFRKGKSFMLNFFLKYLQACESNEDEDWLKDKTEPLKGFSWRGGMNRDTTGILMWSEPFVLKKDGRNIAILLMDTQGCFDGEHTIKDNATVFALSTMLSSIQVYNILHNLQEDNLHILETFTEYGRLALENSSESPFQKLVFLIRDWSFPYDCPYGLKGGQKVLQQRLTVKESQVPQLQRVRSNLRACFKDIECYLMPHPGIKVSTNPTFTGRLDEIEPEFVEHLEIFVPLLLDSKNILLKETAGAYVTGIQLMEYFKVYFSIFKGETMPEPKSMMEATSEANNLAALASAKSLYNSEMEDICGGGRPYVNPTFLETKHNEIKKRALNCFYEIPKFGRETLSKPYFDELVQSLSEEYEKYQSINQSKNMFTLIGAPIVFFIWFALLTILSKVFELFNLLLFANILFTFATICLVFTIIYVILKYQGIYPEFLLGLDEIAKTIWEHLLLVVIAVTRKEIKSMETEKVKNS